MSKPNIILIMCDDLGYGDTGFNGHEVIKTPHLDRLCAEGARFTRFYAGGPVCSPTRGTCLTGRHYSRYGVTHANEGRLPTQEISLATVCKDNGYTTGHFGKWHLGTLTTDECESNRGGPKHPEEYSPPWLHGFDVCFSTEAKVPTWNPMCTPEPETGTQPRNWGQPGTFFGTYYRNEKGQKVTDNMEGDDSRVIVDRVEPFVRCCAKSNTPFLAVVWFHAPHRPIVAGPEYRAMYSNLSEDEQHYYGCVTAMDEQVGRINQLIKELGIERDTAIWFCSDNGPEGSECVEHNGRCRGRTGGLRGRKRSLFNGGVAVPAIVKWPRYIKPKTEYSMPCSTLDYFPTVLDVLDHDMPDQRPLDGISLMPLLRGEMKQRPVLIPYRFLALRESMFDSPTFAMMGNRYKVLSNLSRGGSEDICFDLLNDPYEKRNIASAKPEILKEYRIRLKEFVNSCRKSHSGGDYSEPYQPIHEFQEPTGTWKPSCL